MIDRLIDACIHFCVPFQLWGCTRRDVRGEMVLYNFHASRDWIVFWVNFGWNSINVNEFGFWKSEIHTSRECH